MTTLVLRADSVLKDVYGGGTFDPFVFVPCWKLCEAHALLLAKVDGPRMEVAPSYLAVMRRVTVA